MVRWRSHGSWATSAEYTIMPTSLWDDPELKTVD